MSAFLLQYNNARSRISLKTVEHIGSLGWTVPSSKYQNYLEVRKRLHKVAIQMHVFIMHGRLILAEEDATDNYQNE